MKKLIYSLAFVLAFASESKAQQKTIALVHGNTSTFHAFLDSAMYYAVNGDYIYLPGGVVNFASASSTQFIIDKAVNIVGVGYHPNSSIALGSTQILKSVYIINTASGGSIEGIYFFNSIQFGTTSTNSNVSNYLVKRCYISGSIALGIGGISCLPSSNIYILESIISNGVNANNNNPINTLIEKCFIFQTLLNNSSIIWTGITFRNNIFFLGSFALQNIEYSTFYNNIFYSYTPIMYTILRDVNSCHFANNIFTLDSLQVPVGASNTFTSNFFNQPLNSVFQALPNTTAFSFYNNYHLNPTCPGVNAGTDGTDIGLYGTANPFKDGGIPVNPHIQFKLNSNTANQNGSLPVQIKVKAQDN